MRASNARKQARACSSSCVSMTPGIAENLKSAIRYSKWELYFKKSLKYSTNKVFTYGKTVMETQLVAVAPYCHYIVTILGLLHVVVMSKCD